MKIVKIVTAATVVGALSLTTVAQADTTAHAENMPMGSGQMPMYVGQMPMNPRQMPMHRRHMPMGCDHGGVMNPQIKQQMMANKQAHMKKMENHLSNIEALLRELVEMQKKR